MMDNTFSDDEKRFVLGEMIKVSSLDVPTLVEFIRAHQIEPRWMVMQLPNGRNMNQCLGAVENMFQVKFPPPNLTNFKRSTVGDIIDPPAKRQAVMMPTEQPMAPARIIQPRPPSNGFVNMTGMPPTSISTGPSLTATGKKRGRPSKADKEAQARATFSRSVEYAAITPAPPPPAPARSPHEYTASPSYEIASYSEQKFKKRDRQSATGSPQPPATSFASASPVSNTGTPRLLPEPIDKSTVSLNEHKVASLEKHSPTVLPQFMHHHNSYHHHRPKVPSQQPHSPPKELPHLNESSHPSQSSQAPARPSAAYDPIFPDRDRSQSGPGHSPQVPPPAVPPPISNRS